MNVSNCVDQDCLTKSALILVLCMEVVCNLIQFIHLDVILEIFHIFCLNLDIIFNLTEIDVFI